MVSVVGAGFNRPGHGPPEGGPHVPKVYKYDSSPEIAL